MWRIVLGIGLLCAPQFAVLTFATVFLHDFGRLGLAGISAAMVTLQLGAMVMRVWSGRRPTGTATGARICADRYSSRPARSRCSQPRRPCARAARRDRRDSRLRRHLRVRVARCRVHRLATLAGANQAGTALGMANTIVYLGLFATPLAIPPLLAVSSWSVVWLAAALVAGATYPLFAAK